MFVYFRYYLQARGDRVLEEMVVGQGIEEILQRVTFARCARGRAPLCVTLILVPSRFISTVDVASLGVS